MHYVTCAPVLLCLLLLLHERLQWASVDAHDQWRLHKHSSSVVIILLFQVTYGLRRNKLEQGSSDLTSSSTTRGTPQWDHCYCWCIPYIPNSGIIRSYSSIFYPKFYKHFLNLFLRLMVFLHYHGTVIAQILTSTCSIGGGIFLNSHAEPNTLCVVRLHFDGAGTWGRNASSISTTVVTNCIFYSNIFNSYNSQYSTMGIIFRTLLDYRINFITLIKYLNLLLLLFKIVEIIPYSCK